MQEHELVAGVEALDAEKRLRIRARHDERLVAQRVAVARLVPERPQVGSSGPTDRDAATIREIIVEPVDTLPRPVGHVDASIEQALRHVVVHLAAEVVPVDHVIRVHASDARKVDELPEVGPPAILARALGVDDCATLAWRKVNPPWAAVGAVGAKLAAVLVHIGQRVVPRMVPVVRSLATVVTDGQVEAQRIVGKPAVT